MSSTVRYRVLLHKTDQHLIDVEARFPAVDGPLFVRLPVWTPGSYLVREYARHLQEVEAHDEAGARMPVRRVDKSTFEVDARGKEAHLRYRVYANELSVRTSHADKTHAYFNGATVFLYADPFRGQTHTVEVEARPGWHVHTALGRQDGLFAARSYDELVDSPFAVGPEEAWAFQAAGAPHEVMVWGEPVPDRPRLVSDLSKVCGAVASLFGELPSSRYLFLLLLTDKGRGGLEHMNSTTLLFPRHALATPKGWEDLLTLACHEYFHLWNVKRITPRAFVPFNYQQENYTRLLWAFEGITSYYDNLLVRRAALMSPGRYLNRLGETLTALYSTPGRKLQTLADASLVSWIKHYRPDENTVNTAISYYLKGEIVALLLDLELRRRTDGKKSLDDLMRLLWRRYGGGQGVPEDGVERAAAEVAGVDLSPFFARAVHSTEELDLGALAFVGLEARFRVRESANDRGGSPPRQKATDGHPKGWLGISVKGSSTLSTVVDGSPARAAGLHADDEIVALDGFKVDGASLVQRCEEKSPGEGVRVSVFRREKLLEVEVTLGEKPADAVYLARLEGASDHEKEQYRSWIGAGWQEGAS